MGLLQSIMRPRAASLREPPDWFKEALGARRTVSGISVNERNAMHVSAVFASIRLIAETVASLPFIVYRRLDRGKERLPGHRVYRLLHDQPNEDMTAMVFRETLLSHVLAWGNGYAAILRNGNGQPMDLYPIMPDKVSVERLRGGLIVYRVRDEVGGETIMRPRDVLHIPGLGFDGIVGYSVVRMARESLGLTVAAEQYGAAFFGNNANAGGVIEVPNALSDTAYSRLRDSWEARHRGPENAHKVAILEQGAKFDKTSIPPEDAQFLETRKFQVEDVARWFHVPPHKIGHLERSTFSNIEHQALEFVTDTIRPWLVRTEQEVKRKMFMANEQDLFAEHLVDGLLRGDIKSRYDAYASAIQNGWMTRNEAREIENRNPLDGLDEPLAPLNMVPADKIDEQTDDNEKKATALAESSARRIARREHDRVQGALKRLKADGDSKAFDDWLAGFIPEHTGYVAGAMCCDPETAAAYVRGVIARLDQSDDIEETLRNWKTERTAELLALVKG